MLQAWHRYDRHPSYNSDAHHYMYEPCELVRVKMAVDVLWRPLHSKPMLPRPGCGETISSTLTGHTGRHGNGVKPMATTILALIASLFIYRTTLSRALATTMVLAPHYHFSQSERVFWPLEELGLDYKIVHHTQAPRLLGESIVFCSAGHILVTKCRSNKVLIAGSVLGLVPQKGADGGNGR